MREHKAMYMPKQLNRLIHSILQMVLLKKQDSKGWNLIPNRHIIPQLDNNFPFMEKKKTKN